MSERLYDVQKVSLVVKGPDVQVREITVAPGEEIPWHYHNDVTDWCYCLEGTLVAEIRDRHAPGDVALTRLAPGKSCRIEAGTVHRLTSGGDSVCRYLLVQGGTYDFNKVNG